MQGAFVVGLVLLGVWIGGEAANGTLGWRRPAPLRPLLAVSVACVLASFVNANGLDSWLFPLSYLGGPQSTNLLPFIQEWQPPDPRQLQTAPFVLTLLTVLIVALLRPRLPEPISENPHSAFRIPHLRLPFSGDAT